MESAADTACPVIAVVLTYRRPSGATQVVRDLLETERLDPLQVILVVNGSGGLDDPALEARIRVLHLSENLGAGGGFAHGLQQARDMSPEARWFYLCEDDQGRHRLPSPRLDTLIGKAERLGSDHLPTVGAILSTGRHIDMRTGQTSSHEVDSSEEPLQACDYGGFAGSLLSRRVVDAGVLPDEKMFWGAADLEFWLRVRAAGFRILVDAAAHRASTDKGSSGESWCGYYIARNGFHLGRRHGSPRWILLHLVKTVRRFQLAPSTAHRVAIARGLVDGIRGRTGRNPEFAR